jgi:hypothetical protein
LRGEIVDFYPQFTRSLHSMFGNMAWPDGPCEARGLSTRRSHHATGRTLCAHQRWSDQLAVFVRWHGRLLSDARHAAL